MENPEIEAPPRNSGARKLLVFQIALHPTETTACPSH